jgi:GNAT superfamily N-acetyltransferase
LVLAPHHSGRHFRVHRLRRNRAQCASAWYRSCVHIRRWTTADGDAVTRLIVGIQRGEFGIEITAADQPDLDDVEGWYRADGGDFWVAVDEDRVVGTIAVLRFAPGMGAVRKMFVAPSHRGESGLASALMAMMIEWSRLAGFDSLFLGTTSVMTRAHRFYERQGFELIPQSDLPVGFPLMAVDSIFYRRRLAS